MGEEDGKWGLFYVNGQLIQDELWQIGLLRNVGPYHTVSGRYFVARNPKRRLWEPPDVLSYG